MAKHLADATATPPSPIWPKNVSSGTLNLAQPNPTHSELSSDLLYNFHRWKFVNGAELLPDGLSVLFKCQVHVIHDMSVIFGIANSVYQMRCCIMDYFDNLLVWSFFTFYISASVVNRLHMKTTAEQITTCLAVSNGSLLSSFNYHYYYYMIYIAPISRIESEALNIIFRLTA